jgi:hypothetical protein
VTSEQALDKNREDIHTITQNVEARYYSPSMQKENQPREDFMFL